jgi:methionine-gamma-lyase
MKAHEETALAIGRFLESHPAIERVFYPGLASHPQHELARRQMQNFSGMMTFRTREDGRAVAERMIDRLQIIHYAVSLGHHRSLVYWIPTEMLMQSTFRLDPDAEARYREFAGDGVFRFSIGFEDADDLCADLDRVLA